MIIDKTQNYIRRQKMRLSVITYFLILFAFVSGCRSIQKQQVYTAEYSTEKIKIDGKLNEKAWEKAENLSFQTLDGSSCTENGIAKIIWDDKYIYVGAKLYDSDIVQGGNKDGGHFYKTGDLLEVFLKPNGKRNYWEIYATPNNKKTAFFYYSKGRPGLPNGFSPKMPGLIVASYCEGTLNNVNDRDKFWTTEIAIPRKQLEKHGGQIFPGKEWRFLIGRYNYSVYFDTTKELSLTGKPAGRGFHNFKSWRSINFLSGGRYKKNKIMN
jgi:Carbohydrate family 9 binding domain-like